MTTFPVTDAGAAAGPTTTFAKTLPSPTATLGACGWLSKTPKAIADIKSKIIASISTNFDFIIFLLLILI
jgi:hypothetical protein